MLSADADKAELEMSASWGTSAIKFYSIFGNMSILQMCPIVFFIHFTISTPPFLCRFNKHFCPIFRVFREKPENSQLNSLSKYLAKYFVAFSQFFRYNHFI